MRRQEVSQALEDVVKRAVRRANRNASFALADGPKQGDDLLTINLAAGHIRRAVTVSKSLLERASRSPTEFEKLRLRIKRVIDRALHAERPHFIFASKSVRPGSESVNFFRPSGARR